MRMPNFPAIEEEANMEFIKAISSLMIAKTNHDLSESAIAELLEIINFLCGQMPHLKIPELKSFRDMALFLESYGWNFTSEIEYLACRRCFHVYRGPDELDNPSQTCKQCGAARKEHVKFYYR